MIADVLRHLEALVAFDTRNPPRAQVVEDARPDRARRIARIERDEGFEVAEDVGDHFPAFTCAQSVLLMP